MRAIVFSVKYTLPDRLDCTIPDLQEKIAAALAPGVLELGAAEDAAELDAPEICQANGDVVELLLNLVTRPETQRLLQAIAPVKLAQAEAALALRRAECPICGRRPDVYPTDIIDSGRRVLKYGQHAAAASGVVCPASFAPVSPEVIGYGEVDRLIASFVGA